MDVLGWQRNPTNAVLQIELEQTDKVYWMLVPRLAGSAPKPHRLNPELIRPSVKTMFVGTTRIQEGVKSRAGFLPEIQESDVGQRMLDCLDKIPWKRVHLLATRVATRQTLFLPLQPSVLPLPQPPPLQRKLRQ